MVLVEVIGGKWNGEIFLAWKSPHLSFLILYAKYVILFLDERHTHLGTLFAHVFRPDAGLNLADVRLVEHHHA